MNKSILILLFVAFSFISTAQYYGYSSVKSKHDEILRYEEKFKENEKKIAKYESQKRTEQYELEVKLNDLLAEKKRALQELRNGEYCSKCKRPKSQVESETGDSFSYHLNKVSGRRMAATPEMIKKTTADYDRKIKAVQDKLNKFYTNTSSVDSQINKYKLANDEIQNPKLPELRRQMRELTNQWTQKAYDKLLNAELQGHLTNIRKSKQIVDTDDRIAGLRKKLAKFKKDYKRDYEKRTKALEKTIDQKLLTLNSKITKTQQEILDTKKEFKLKIDKKLGEMKILSDEFDLNEKFIKMEKDKKKKDSLEHENNLLKQKYAVHEKDLKNLRSQKKTKLDGLNQNLNLLKNGHWNVWSNRTSDIWNLQDIITNAFKDKENIIIDALAKEATKRDLYIKALEASETAVEDDVNGKYNELRQDQYEVDRLCREAGITYGSYWSNYSSYSNDMTSYYSSVRKSVLSKTSCSDCRYYLERDPNNKYVGEMASTYLTILASTSNENNKYLRQQVQEHKKKRMNELLNNFE